MKVYFCYEWKNIEIGDKCHHQLAVDKIFLSKDKCRDYLMEMSRVSSYDYDSFYSVDDMIHCMEVEE